MNGFGIGAPMGAAPQTAEREERWKRFGTGGCVVLDMPGYGGGSREEWGAEILKVLENRKQLRRAFLLVDAEHGLKSSDISLLLHLRQQGVPHQVILSKADKLLYPGAKMPGALKLRIVLSSCETQAIELDRSWRRRQQACRVQDLVISYAVVRKRVWTTDRVEEASWVWMK